MVNPDKIRQKLALIETNLGKLNQLKQLSKSDFLSDFRNSESAKHLLQVSIEAMSDLCDHFIARKRLGNPENTAASFRIMAENGYLEQKNITNYVTMTKFRNKVVHLYFEINDAEVYDIIQNNLSDFKTFIAEILKLL
jgi:uncharacterized protein YutE (UPF0331/DUF86 family)